MRSGFDMWKSEKAHLLLAKALERYQDFYPGESLTEAWTSLGEEEQR
jgi:transposase